MAATTKRTRRLKRALAAVLIGFIGLLAQFTPIHLGTPVGRINAQIGVATPWPVVGQSSQNTLFHDDFTTKADRWRLLGYGTNASVGFDIGASTLDIAVATARYALWSIPDTDLMPDQADVQVQADWSAGNADSQFGIVLDYRNDNDMLVVAVARNGQVRIGHYLSRVWSDVTPSVHVPLDPNQPVTVRAMLVVIGNVHHLITFVDNQIAQSIALPDFKAGKFGFFAENGVSGAMALALHSFTVYTVTNSETF